MQVESDIVSWGNSNTNIDTLGHGYISQSLQVCRRIRIKSEVEIEEPSEQTIVAHVSS